MNGSMQRLTLTPFLAALVIGFGAPSPIFAQQSPNQQPANEVAQDEAAFVNQAPEEPSSKVYFPEAITPQSVEAARARAARQQQIEARAQAAARRADPLAQVSKAGGGNDVAQLSDGSSSTAALAQLSAGERQVLLDAVEGTDICERGSDIPALKALCDARLETRSEEFTQNSQEGSAEDNLLGGGLDAGRAASLQTAIARLAGAEANPGNFDNQVVASVALNNQALSDAQATAAEGDPTAELSDGTRALVSAIVQQLGGGN